MRRYMDSQVLVAIVGGLFATLASFGAWFGGRRRGAAEAVKAAAEADVMLSTEARAIATDLRAELATERADRRRLEGRVDELEAELVAERRRCAGLETRVAELEKLIRRAGLHLPGDTPPEGVPVIVPPLDPEGGAA